MPIAGLFTVQLLLNNIVSTESAKFMTMDISKVYPMTLFKRKEYTRMKFNNSCMTSSITTRCRQMPHWTDMYTLW